MQEVFLGENTQLGLLSCWFLDASFSTFSFRFHQKVAAHVKTADPVSYAAHPRSFKVPFHT